MYSLSSGFFIEGFPAGTCRPGLPKNTMTQGQLNSGIGRAEKQINLSRNSLFPNLQVVERSYRCLLFMKTGIMRLRVRLEGVAS
jgi:hypothetical protein